MQRFCETGENSKHNYKAYRHICVTVDKNTARNNTKPYVEAVTENKV